MAASRVVGLIIIVPVAVQVLEVTAVVITVGAMPGVVEVVTVNQVAMLAVGLTVVEVILVVAMAVGPVVIPAVDQVALVEIAEVVPAVIVVAVRAAVVVPARCSK